MMGRAGPPNVVVFISDQQRAGKAEFDVAPHVVADAGLVQPAEVGFKARDDDVAYALEVLLGPVLGLGGAQAADCTR